MKGMNTFTLTVRRKSFIKSIRTQQREQYKAEKRQKIIEEMNPSHHLWRFKLFIENLNLPNQQVEAINIIDFIKEHSHSLQFCDNLKSTSVLEQLIKNSTESLKNNPDLYIPHLIEKLIDLVYFLLAKSNVFLSIIEKQFHQLMICLYRFPANQKIFEISSQFCVCADEMFSNKDWISNYHKIKVINEEEIIKKLTNIYIFGGSYIVNEGQQMNQINKHSNVWFKNAIKCLQIIYSLIGISFSSSKVKLSKHIKKGLYVELNSFLSQNDLLVKSLQSDHSDSDSQTNCENQMISFEPSSHYQRSNIYFIYLILDIVGIQEELLEQNQIETLKKLLEILLNNFEIHNCINILITKILKLFYEEIIFTQDDLQDIASKYKILSESISSILQNDMI